MANKINEFVTNPSLTEPIKEPIIPTTPLAVNLASGEPVISQRLEIVCDLLEKFLCSNQEV